MKMEQICKLNSSVKCRPTQNGNALAIHMGSGDLLELNGTGVDIVKYVDGNRSIQAIVDSLAVEYDAPADILAQDVLDFMTKLVNSGFAEAS